MLNQGHWPEHSVHQSETNAAYTYVDEQDIFICQFKDSIHLETSDIKQIIEQYDHVRQTKPMLFLSIAGKHTNVTAEGREYAELNASVATAEAFVVHSFAQRIIVSLYMTIRKKEHPTRVFGDIRNAKEWLLSYRK